MRRYIKPINFMLPALLYNIFGIFSIDKRYLMRKIFLSPLFRIYPGCIIYNNCRKAIVGINHALTELIWMSAGLRISYIHNIRIYLMSGSGAAYPEDDPGVIIRRSLRLEYLVLALEMWDNKIRKNNSQNINKKSVQSP